MPKPNPLMTMVVPGRRAMGEQWSKVNIYPDPDTGAYIVEREDSAAPADQCPIFVPGMGNISLEMADFILDRSRDEAQTRAKQPKRDLKAELNAAWQDFCEQKLRWDKGK